MKHNNGTVNPWSESMTKALRKMAHDGFTCGQVAKALGVTRNTVIGKAYRMGVKWAKAPDVTLTTEERRERHAARQRAYAAKQEALKREREVRMLKQCLHTDEPIDLSHLPTGRGECQWIEGEAVGRKFCCAPVVQGRSWCPHHYAIVFDIKRTAVSTANFSAKRIGQAAEFFTLGERTET